MLETREKNNESSATSSLKVKNAILENKDPVLTTPIPASHSDLFSGRNDIARIIQESTTRQF